VERQPSVPSLLDGRIIIQQMTEVMMELVGDEGDDSDDFVQLFSIA